MRITKKEILQREKEIRSLLYRYFRIGESIKTERILMLMYRPIKEKAKRRVHLTAVLELNTMQEQIVKELEIAFDHAMWKRMKEENWKVQLIINNWKKEMRFKRMKASQTGRFSSKKGGNVSNTPKGRFLEQAEGAAHSMAFMQTLPDSPKRDRVIGSVHDSIIIKKGPKKSKKNLVK